MLRMLLVMGVEVILANDLGMAIVGLLRANDS
jgi:hypothetical protein